ncbi:LURP-one-related/scramblase family protein [Carnobacterium funditum]|uniref:LURP-one-related/scramblase family protein n=1 Tax=Carnobacterium funditum TaxID=2752 RepID=UPI00055270A2|nr:LURP-one-related family protein [Carnobacterium funditum]
MNYYIKQKIFSWSDKFTVKDSQGRDVYSVEGEFLSWVKKLHVRDMSGKEVLYIEQQLWKFLPTYSLYIDDKERAKVSKEFTFFKPRYTIEGPAWQVEGSIWEHDYQIMSNQKVMADISKEWLTWGDTYALDIKDEDHALLALGVIIVIDCVMASQRAAASGGS